jgi:hypothetical protein
LELALSRRQSKDSFMFVIIISFALVSGADGEIVVNRQPPMETLAVCEAARPLVIEHFRDVIEATHGAIRTMESRCEAAGTPA